MWGGRTCRGKREEWKICGTNECLAPEDFRAQQCSQLSQIVNLDKRRADLNWRPYEPKNSKCTNLIFRVLIIYSLNP